MPAEYTYNAQVERLRQFVKALGIKTFHLDGNSMGGGIAGLYTSRYARQVKSLWLIATAGVSSSQPSELAQRLSAGQDNPLIVGNEQQYEALLDFVFVERPYIPGPIKKYFTQEAISNQHLNQIIFKQIRSSSDATPLEVILKNSATKTLILWGAQDRVLHVSGAAILQAVMHNAKSVVLPNVGHVPMVEKPAESANAFLLFMGKIQQRGRKSP